MKKFCLNTILYLLLVLLLVSVPNIIYNACVYYGTDEAKFQVVPEMIDICNLGSSHGQFGYYYKDWEGEYSCFNLAMGSQPLSYDKRILEHYAERLHPGSIVFIDISYFAIWGKSEVEGDDFLSRNKRYYKFLPPWMIKAYDFTTDLWVRFFPLFSDEREIIKNTIFSPISASELKSYPEVDKTTNSQDAVNEGLSACERHIGSGQRDDQGVLQVNEEEKESLYEIVQICRAHGAEPIFVTVPYLQEYKDAINLTYPDFMDMFICTINDISDELDVSWYDYSSDKHFSHNYDLFQNADHLNSVGAREFTNMIMERVVS